MPDNKREQREEKRAVKKSGNRRRRRELDRDLRENPDEAHLADDAIHPLDQSQPLNAQPTTFREYCTARDPMFFTESPPDGTDGAIVEGVPTPTEEPADETHPSG